MDESNLLSALLGGSILLLLFIAVIAIVVAVLYIVGLWKLFKKAGKNGWEAIIPFYNNWVLIEISGLNWWYFFILISGTILTILGNFGISLPVIPLVSRVAVYFFIFYNLGKRMNKNPSTFGILGLFFSGIMTMVIGLSKDYQYDGSIEVSKNGPIGVANNSNSNNEPERYCLGCGQKLKPNTAFCENCGKKVE